MGSTHDEGRNCKKKIEKYSIATESLKTVGNMFDVRPYFTACGFLDDIYFVGGCLRGGCATATCLKFHTKDYTWKSIQSMKEARSLAACTVFEERVVVSCGSSNTGLLNTNEAYDHIADEWSCIPSTIERTSCHSSIALKNKLFAVVARNKFLEVHDSTCKKFVAIKNPPFKRYNNPFSCFKNAIGLENKIAIFLNKSSKVLFYDTDTNE